MTVGQKILVIGGTRGTGQFIARRLAETGHEVRVLARNPDRARALFSDSVEVVGGDVTDRDTLLPAVAGVEHLIFTAGVTHRPAAESLVKATVYDGVLNTIAAARESGFTGRFVLMGAVGTTRASMLSFLLNLIKGKTLHWRSKAEEALRASGLDYTIIHAGILVDGPVGERPIVVGQSNLPMRWRHRISRADAAEVIVRALFHPAARNASLDAVWVFDGPAPALDEQFAALHPDDGVARAGRG
jgi:uncharacterized protein YbjT (DUF2867 family)